LTVGRNFGKLDLRGRASQSGLKVFQPALFVAGFAFLGCRDPSEWLIDGAPNHSPRAVIVTQDFGNFN
jgi:hypothetical protein